MNTPDPTITAEDAALSRLGEMAGYIERNGYFPPHYHRKTADDIRIALALSRRALASGAGGDEPSLVEELVAALKLFHGRLRPYTSGTDAAIRAADKAIARADAHQPPEPKPAPDHAELVALVDELNLLATIKQTFSEMKNVDDGVRHQCRGKRYAYSHAAQLLKSRLADALASAPSGEVETK